MMVEEECAETSGAAPLDTTPVTAETTLCKSTSSMSKIFLYECKLIQFHSENINCLFCCDKSPYRHS
jgi:hypothetical protein